MSDLFKVDDVTSSVNQHRVSNPQQPQFPVSANIPAPMGVPRPASTSSIDWVGGYVWHGVAGCSENCFSAKNAKEMM